MDSELIYGQGSRNPKDVYFNKNKTQTLFSSSCAVNLDLKCSIYYRDGGYELYKFL